jgi:AraC family transcriptional regulator of adaptative response/methylated-DNA-[protein]-cysteine methyltransferase
MSASILERRHITENDPRWPTVLARSDDGFYYSVRTTGVYCRPSCPARRPRPENVRFHSSREEAERAGFRPCRRCRPDLPVPARRHAAMAAAACRRIEMSESPPSLKVLAAAAGLSPGRFHRLFKAATGLTPGAYFAAHRAGRLRAALERGEAVSDAIYHAGYGSGSRFYEKSDTLLGMSPTRYRRGGADCEIRFAVGECSLGSILVACSERGVCTISLGGDPETLVRELQDRFPRAELIGGDAEFEQRVARVVALIEAPALGLDLPLDIRGTAFQQRVWQALTRIPPGTTASYGDIARRIGSPGSARAVARACAANPLAVAIPCHRVVRNDGGLSGYRWGIARKRALLEREAGTENTD